jgi:putative ABC transport system substrate-binding protein
MIRNIFAALLSALMFPLLYSGVTAAQDSRQLVHLGVLISESGRNETQSIKGLRDGLKALGYKERENILLELRDAKGDRSALKSAADDLVQKKVSLIFTTGTRTTEAAKAATTRIPIVFRHPADPIALGLVKSMSRPGGNITGVAGLALEKTEKRLDFMKQIVPGARRVLLFYDQNDRFSRENFASARNAAQKLGLQVLEYGVKSADELKKSFDGLQKNPGDAFFQMPDNLVETEADFIFETARQKKLPTMFNDESWAIRGALGAYGPSYYHMGRQAALLAGQILKGANPGDLPVQRAEKFDLVINYRTARVIGLAVPPEILKKADRVIR